MGFYSTTLEQEKPHQKTSDCAQKTASGNFFASNRNRTYQIERNPLETQQEKLTTTTETASGVFLYKYRHYSAELGRWLGRDPIEEEGGVNLYAFVGNDPIGRWDKLGLANYNIACICVDSNGSVILVPIEVIVAGSDESADIYATAECKRKGYSHGGNAFRF